MSEFYKVSFEFLSTTTYSRATQPRSNLLPNPQPILPITPTLPTKMSSASSSTTSLATVSSRAPLNGSSAVPPKDFQAAFARLQSTYGFSASAPSPVQKSAAPPSAPRSTAAVASPTAPKSKDFEAAFADLQSTYGFSGSVPSPVPAPKKQGGASLFSRFTRASSPATPAQKTKVRHVPHPTAQMSVL
ncbi:hypothetical protein DFH09DRAFT_503359 [Mycena vulgaris]|nr:hypothetical protein DFH09DRAFT_503359 [Mycena vulgaris]